MGEIKSTLDLVMEKTSHLKLSDKEKKEQSLQEARGRLKGLIDKYRDQRIRLEQLKNELEAFKNPDGGIDERWLMLETIAHLDLERDNAALISVLSEYFRMDTGPIESALSNYARALQSAAEARMAEIRENLAQIFAVSGSAVLPNLEGDSGWSDVRKSLQVEHAATLEKIKSELAV